MKSEAIHILSTAVRLSRARSTHFGCGRTVDFVRMNCKVQRTGRKRGVNAARPATTSQARQESTKIQEAAGAVLYQGQALRFSKMESDLFHDAEFPMKCQACGNTTQIKVSDLEKNPEVACPKCGLTTNIEADDLKKMRGTINQAAEKFKDALRRRSK
jgi:predicted RNA-binding Zn-ribbon protein involved in translation (DUF1610 family)